MFLRLINYVMLVGEGLDMVYWFLIGDWFVYNLFIVFLEEYIWDVCYVSFL